MGGWLQQQSSDPWPFYELSPAQEGEADTLPGVFVEFLSQFLLSFIARHFDTMTYFYTYSHFLLRPLMNAKGHLWVPNIAKHNSAMGETI